MKKIKSVKLKNDYRSWNLYVPKGTVLDYAKADKEWILRDDLTFDNSEIMEDITDLFEIEYEPERKFILVRIEYDECYVGNWLSADYISIILKKFLSPHRNIKVTELPNEKGI
jgi:hypothetical protein